MEQRRIDHIAIAVKDIDAALKFWEDAMGIECSGIETVPEQKVTTAFLPLANGDIELISAAGPDSPVAKFINDRGEGIHHIAVSVDDVAAAADEARSRGMRLVNEQPQRGAGGAKIVFVHPGSTGGVLLELCQR